MVLSHFTALTVFAVIVSTVFALITKNEPREQLRYGIFVFVSFLAVAFVVGWLMFPLPLSGYHPLPGQ
jgi:galactitol-specific phosphotransferase system IIC component